ncbi:hypothetical protein [Burkholderia sp. WSM2232]|uniref:hypothetical protein n=1 Tax=Burkholderia sp. WSM2232 TaxID=944436 RepID=UPI00042A1F47|nr:hypothetical protein [Burkholderia sp. WSM2232]
MKSRSLSMLLAALSVLGPFATDSHLPAPPAVARQFAVSEEMVISQAIMRDTMAGADAAHAG